MTNGDIPAVMAIAHSLPQAPHWPRNVYETALNPASPCPRIALVAETFSGAPAGFAIASLSLASAELESIAVAPGSQRQGIAGHLIRQLAKQLRQCGVESVFLEVRASNQPARNLYISLNFSETGRRKDYYTEPAEDAIVLSLSLRPASVAGPATE